MAQSEVKVHIEIDASKARQAVKRVIREAEVANRELAQLEERCRELEDRLARMHGIDIIREET